MDKINSKYCFERFLLPDELPALFNNEKTGYKNDESGFSESNSRSIIYDSKYKDSRKQLQNGCSDETFQFFKNQFAMLPNTFLNKKK